MKHLGGHLGVTHVDTGALAWLKRNGVNTLLDVGCSMGWQVEAARKIGIDTYGFDGDYNLVNNPNVKCLDYIFFNDLTKACPKFPVIFDGIWCCEVAEHIEEKYTDNLLGMIYNNLKYGGYLVFTANEGPGVHHVNRKPLTWWREKLKDFGLFWDENLTNGLVTCSTMEREFIRKTGNVYKKV